MARPLVWVGCGCNRGTRKADRNSTAAPVPALVRLELVWFSLQAERRRVNAGVDFVGNLRAAGSIVPDDRRVTAAGCAIPLFGAEDEAVAAADAPSLYRRSRSSAQTEDAGSSDETLPQQTAQSVVSREIQVAAAVLASAHLLPGPEYSVSSSSCREVVTTFEFGSPAVCASDRVALPLPPPPARTGGKMSMRGCSSKLRPLKIVRFDLVIVLPRS